MPPSLSPPLGVYEMTWEYDPDDTQTWESDDFIQLWEETDGKVMF